MLTLRDRKSVQEVSKQNIQKTSYAKTNLRYWEQVVYRPYYTRNGQRVQVGDYHVKIQHDGRREGFALKTSNKAAAADKAKRIYIYLVGRGWDETISEFKPGKVKETGSLNKVGEFIEAAQSRLTVTSRTSADYARSFRTIVSGVFELGDAEASVPWEKGKRDEWLEKVNKVCLTEVTPQRVLDWKKNYLDKACGNEAQLRHTRNSLNSIIRKAKSLFSPKLLHFMKLEEGFISPFDGVFFEPRQSMRYSSDIDLGNLVNLALVGNDEKGVDALPVEQQKMFLLAAMAGLRRNEIDKLEWRSFRWDENIIRLLPTDTFRPKSEDSMADIEVDPELMKRFKAFSDSQSGKYVIQSEGKPQVGSAYSQYRCHKDFFDLNKWLRKVGVDETNPLHTLRKEFGSHMCSQHGIYAASRALRHGDVYITSQHYVDLKERHAPGLGALFGGNS